MKQIEHNFTLNAFHSFGGVNLLHFHARLNLLLDVIREYSCAFINETGMLGYCIGNKIYISNMPH
jgi:hypothetical protein